MPILDRAGLTTLRLALPARGASPALYPVIRDRPPVSGPIPSRWMGGLDCSLVLSVPARRRSGSRAAGSDSSVRGLHAGHLRRADRADRGGVLRMRADRARP